MKKLILTSVTLLLFSLVFCQSDPESINPPAGSMASESDELFNPSKVWDIHLGFTEENWDALDPEKEFDPKTGTGSFFGWGGFFVPAFFSEGDADKNGQLTKQEFKNLGEKWYKDWSSENEDFLAREQINRGFGQVHSDVNGGKIHLSGSSGERNGIASVLGIEFPETMTDMSFGDQEFVSAAIRYKGNGTYMNARGSNKLPFKIDLNDGYPGRKLDGVVKLNLHNCITDPSYMNEVIAHQLFRDADVPAPRTSYAKVHVTVPDQFDNKYFGLYSIVENVDKRFIEDRFGTKKGAIFKPVTPFLFKDLGDNWSAYDQIYDPKTDLKENEKWRLIDLCRLVSNASDHEFTSRIGEFIDLDETARFVAVCVVISDLDGILGPGQNMYLYLNPKDDKFVFIPWDQDHSFGQFGRTQEEREQLSIFKPWTGENRFLERLYQVEAFKEVYLDHIQKVNDSLFQPERIKAQVEQLAKALRPALAQDTPENLKLFNRLVSMDSHHSYSNILPARKEGDPSPSPGSFGSDPEAKPIKGFVAARTMALSDQLEGRSRGLDDVVPEEKNQAPGSWGFANVFMAEMDQDGDQQISQEEFSQGFAKWYAAWNLLQEDPLTEKELKVGISQTMAALQGNN